VSDERSLSDEATYAQSGRPPRSEVSIGAEPTIGAEAALEDTTVDGIEVVDLEARYTLEGTLGQGGMGAVQLATDTRLGRRVAIKRILGDAARSRAAIARFVTEAKAIAALNHPNIVQIYDYGRAKDGPFLIMEYVDGGSLADLCKAGAVPVERAIDLVCQVCEGLAMAHEQGIVHRDIKPANILLNRAGVPKLTDFGLAKAEAADHAMTVTGAVMGTPDFMPPEQRRDSSLVDHRSDLWSLTATFYQLVTGRSPKIIRFKDVPEALHDVLGKALEDEKDARYQSATELRDALRHASAVAGQPAVREKSREGHTDLGVGECAACHTSNDSQRKFCRECAASLRCPCLACETQIPVWDKVCPECGKKQPELLAARLEDLDAKRTEAESLRHAFAFDDALAAAESLQCVTDDRFGEFIAWHDTFIRETTEARTAALANQDSKVDEAKKHRAAYDYTAAMHALESIPEPLRSNTAAKMLAVLRSESQEAASLLGTIRDKIARKELDDLLPLAQRAVQLRGDRDDLRKLVAQLTERQTKMHLHTAECFYTANRLFSTGDAKGALEKIQPARTPLTNEQSRLKKLLMLAVDQENKLHDLLVAAKADGTVTPDEVVAIANQVARCLFYNPRHTKIAALERQLLDRIEKTPSDYERRVTALAPFIQHLGNRAPAYLIHTFVLFDQTRSDSIDLDLDVAPGSLQSLSGALDSGVLDSGLGLPDPDLALEEILESAAGESQESRGESPVYSSGRQCPRCRKVITAGQDFAAHVAKCK